MWRQLTPTTTAPTYAAKAAPRTTPAEAVRLFIRRSEGKGLSPRTVGFYRERLGIFLRWLETQRLPATEPGDVPAAAIREFLAQEKARTSAATARHGFVALSAFYNFCGREGMVKANPMRQVEKPKAPVRLIAPLSEDEIAALLAACGRGFAGARMKALLVLLVDTGLRASEVCGLRLCDLDLDEQAVKVAAAKGGRERIVPFGLAAKTALMDYLARRGELPGQGRVFVNCYGGDLTPRQLHKALADHAKRAGVRNLHPHRLRHTAAVMFLRNGGDAFTLQRMLGHADLTMTRRYCALADTDLRLAHRAASPGDRFLAAVKPTTGRRRLR
jgi:site-specific recombinase XerD